MSTNRKVQGYVSQLRDVYSGHLDPNDVLVRETNPEAEKKEEDAKKPTLGLVATEISKEEATFRMLDEARQESA